VEKTVDAGAGLPGPLGLAVTDSKERRMRFFGILLLSLPLVAMASPLGSGVDSRRGLIDPFHGDWKCLRCTVWDEKGKQTDGPVLGMVTRFERDRMIVLFEQNALSEEHSFRVLNPKGDEHRLRIVSIDHEEHSFRVLNPKGDAEGKIELIDKNKVSERLRYRFSGGRFFLCMKADNDSDCPDSCGPGKNRRLFEFLPYQPKRLVQSHPIHLYERLKGEIGP
jgi:hypothetical protein